MFSKLLPEHYSTGMQINILGSHSHTSQKIEEASYFVI